MTIASQHRKRLLARLGAGIGAGLICLLVPFTILRALAATPLIFLLPGVQVLSALDPYHRRFSGGERLYWGILASLVLAILGGLILDVVASLDATNWIGFILLSVLVSTFFAWGPAGHHTHHGFRSERSPSTPIVNRKSKVLLVCAGALLVGALVLSQRSSSTTSSEHFTQLWILPRPLSAADYASTFQLGIYNNEGRTCNFLLKFGSPGETERVIHIRLHEGERWVARFPRPVHERVAATVTFASQPSRVLASVHLDAPAG